PEALEGDVRDAIVTQCDTAMRVTRVFLKRGNPGLSRVYLLPESGTKAYGLEEPSVRLRASDTSRTSRIAEIGRRAHYIGPSPAYWVL
ncbi:MAG: hypothetical protein ACREMY_15225, partial [bacterium]